MPGPRQTCAHGWTSGAENLFCSQISPLRQWTSRRYSQPSHRSGISAPLLWTLSSPLSHSARPLPTKKSDSALYHVHAITKKQMKALSSLEILYFLFFFFFFSFFILIIIEILRKTYEFGTELRNVFKFMSWGIRQSKNLLLYFPKFLFFRMLQYTFA